MQKVKSNATSSQASVSTQVDKKEESNAELSSLACIKVNRLSHKKNYMKFRFHGIVYSEGDTVMLSDGSNGYFVAKIMKFILKGGIPAYKDWPTLQVQWYYRKADILSWVELKEDYAEFLSEYEVFQSSHFENVIIESIISKCSITTIEKYEQLPNDENVFFTRAAFDHKTVILTFII